MQPASTILYVVRHGETEWNRIEKQQGHLNSPLTERGIEQAVALSEGLSERGIELIYSSDLGRAFHTAKTIAEFLGLSIQTDPRLRERHLGLMQGLTKHEFRSRYGQDWLQFESGDPEYILPDGESASQRYQRSVACAEDLSQKHRGQTILLVTHGGVLDGFFRKSVGIPLAAPRTFSLFNAAINRFSIADTIWHLDTWADLAHLKNTVTLDDN